MQIHLTNPSNPVLALKQTCVVTAVLVLSTNLGAQPKPNPAQPNSPSSQGTITTGNPSTSTGPESSPNANPTKLPDIIVDKGQAIPAGYHRDTRLNPWLATVGISVLSISYTPALVIGLVDSDLSLLLIPIAGPPIQWLTVRGDCKKEGGGIENRCKVGDSLFVGWGAVQLGGAALIGLSALIPQAVFARDGGPAPNETIIRDNSSKVSLPVVTPILGYQGVWGVSAGATFLVKNVKNLPTLS